MENGEIYSSNFMLQALYTIFTNVGEEDDVEAGLYVLMRSIQLV